MELLREGQAFKMRKDMKRVKKRLVAPMGAVLCVCAFLLGCERGASTPASQSVPTSTVSRAGVNSTTASIEERAHDPAYQKRLGEFVEGMKRIVQRRAKIEARMAPLRELAKKAVPPDATEAQVEAELEGNPKRYPGWNELVAARKSLAVEEEKLKAAAQAAVARRISGKETEGRAPGAVSEAK